MVDETLVKEFAALGVERLPTEDDLPYSDGMPMESERHVLQMTLLIQPLRIHWAERQDFYVGGDMFVYFSAAQLRNQDFRGPDVFVALDVPRRERKSWVVWEEGKGPDVVIELLSESTAATDKGEKKQIYQDQLQVPEYYWYDPFSGELAGFALSERQYQPIRPDRYDRLLSGRLRLLLMRWEGVYGGVHASWLRWGTAEGALLPTGEELADRAQQQAAAAEREAAAAQRQAAAAQQQAATAQQDAAAAQQEATAAHQQAVAAQQEAAEMRERRTELEALLARYQQRYGSLGDGGEEPDRAPSS